jgi:hypothetical protein
MELETIYTYGAMVGTFIAGFVIQYLRKKKEAKTDCEKNADFGIDLLKKTTQREVKLQDILSELRVRIDADRAYLVKFHNGGEFFDGTSIKRLTKTNESCRVGVAPDGDSFQAVHTSLVPDLMKFICESSTKDTCEIIEVEKLGNSYYKSHLLAAAVEYAVIYRIVLEEKLIGYLGVHYNNKSISSNSDLKKMFPKIEQEMKETCSSIEGAILTYKNKTSKK